MSETPRREARDHIRRIEAGYVPETENAITKALTEAIRVLSEELYGNATHFIQELLQNSDDNSFDCSDPSITFTYRPGSLRVDCNEKGFNPADVDAICAIRSSTKAGKSHYTGEKGIGFKSVFRAADVVWVASRAYRFKFDRSQRFGILSPKWAEFPEQELYNPDHTSFYLMLSPDFNERELVNELRCFDPTQLVFMRRLRKIHVRIYSTQNDVIPWEQTIHRTDSTDSSIISLDVGDSTQQYLIREHKLTKLPSAPNRSESTTLVLAFPITDISVESPYHKVYAGLPIGEVEMFRFLLHGDFLLTASRSDIDASLPWNQALRDGLSEALFWAFRDLRNGDSCLSWPKFLAFENEGFFHSAMKSFMRSLQEEKCLETSAEGHMARPADVTYVGKRFCDTNGQPFTLWSGTAPRYLCTGYPPMTIGNIKDLGVQELTGSKFVKDLHQMVSEDPIDFQSRSSSWHSQLCKALLSLLEDRRLRDLLGRIPIIPLSDGRWTAASDSPKPVLDIKLDDFRVSDLFPTIDRSATISHHRKALFMALGIGSIDTSQLCQTICEEHSSLDFNPWKYSISQLIAHAKLLYRLNWSPPSGDLDLWFATSRDGRCKGSKLYLDGDHGTKSSAARIFNLIRQRCPIIHPDYLRSFSRLAPSPAISRLGTRLWLSKSFDTSEEGVWRSYLMESLHVSRTPRLVDITALPKGQKKFCLSDDFKYLLQNGHIADVVSTLDQNWHFYSQWIHPDTSQKQSNEKRMQAAQLVDTIGNAIVETSQQPLPLRMTSIPDLDHQIDDTVIPTLDLKTPVQKSLRDRLGLFGVTVDNDLRFYLACLRFLKGQACPDIDTIAYIYERIQHRLDDEEVAVEKAFNGEALIYIGPMVKKTRKTPTLWTDAGDCRARSLDVQELYPRSSRLFVWLLDTGHLTLRQTIQAAIAIDNSWTETRIVNTLSYISQYLGDWSPKRAALAVESLRSRPMFPVIRGEVGGKSISKVFVSAENENWFVADRSHLEEAFLGKVPLLSLHLNDIARIGDLLKALGLEPRKLSVAAKVRKFATGELNFDTSYTNFFRKRARFIEELIPKPKSKQEHVSLCQQIESVRVSVAAEIHEIYSLKRVASEIMGRPCRCEMLFSATEDRLQIFVAAQSRTPRQCLTAAIINEISVHFGIQDPRSMGLLCTIFIETEMDQIQQAFSKQGYRLPRSKSILEKDSTTNMHRWIRAEDLISIPLPLSDVDSSDDTQWPDSGSKYRTAKKGIHYRRPSRTSHPENKPPAPHIRQLPLLFSSEQVGEEESKKDLTDANLALEYLGECLASRLFETELRGLYDPLKHWTSPLRVRGGIPDPGRLHDDSSPFTLAGPFVTTKITELLIRLGVKAAQQWRGLRNLTYHCEVAVSTGGMEDQFCWTTKKLLRALAVHPRGQLQGQVRDVMIMIRIAYAYSKPTVRLCLDPFDLISRSHMKIVLSPIFQARVLGGHKDDPGSSGDDNSSNDLVLINDGSTRISRERFQLSGSQSPAQPSISLQFASSKALLQSIPLAPYTYPESTFQRNLFSSKPGLAYGLLAYGSSQLPSSARLGYWPAWTGRSALPDAMSISTEPRSQRDTSTSAPGHNELPVSKIIEILDNARLFPYAYRQLSEGEIRLFTLFPGRYDDVIKGMIHCVPFNAIGPFYALSYVWGGAEQPTHQVVTPDGFLYISASLQMNLARLRRQNEPLMIWVDAICIDQENREEKSKQVQLLPRVFQRADCTVAILDSGIHDNEAVQMLLKVGAFHDPRRDSEDWPDKLEGCPASRGPSGIPPPDDPVWARVAELFNNTWFRRVWIVQEAVASPLVVIVCGRHVVLWQDISGAMRHIDHEMGHRLPPPVRDAWKPFEALDSLRNWESRHTRWPVLQLLEQFRHVSSTLARDRLFALLGISCDGDLKGFEPDYIAPFEKVVLAFARALVGAGRGLELLHRAGIECNSERFPSWVPNWTIPKLSGLYAARDRGLLFNASGKTEAQIKCRQIGPQDELLVDGYDIDSIKGISDSSNMPGKWKTYFDEVDSMVDSLGLDDEMDRYRLKRDVPIAGATHPPVACSQTLDIEEGYKAFRRVLKKSQWTKKFQRQECEQGSKSSANPSTKGLQPKNELGLREKSEVYKSLLGGTLEGWRFVITEGNRCGIAPPAVGVGHRIIIPRGGELPFLLQVGQDRTNAHRLVGECYIAGIMFGEVFKSGNLVQSTFRIY